MSKPKTRNAFVSQLGKTNDNKFSQFMWERQYKWAKKRLDMWDICNSLIIEYFLWRKHCLFTQSAWPTTALGASSWTGNTQTYLNRTVHLVWGARETCRRYRPNTWEKAGGPACTLSPYQPKCSRIHRGRPEWLSSLSWRRGWAGRKNLKRNSTKFWLNSCQNMSHKAGNIRTAIITTKAWITRGSELATNNLSRKF